MPTRYSALAGPVLVSLTMLLSTAPGWAQETWQRSGDPRYQPREEAYRPVPGPQRYEAPGYDDPAAPQPGRGDAYPAPRPNDAYPPRFGAQAAPSNEGYSPRTGSVNPPVDEPMSRQILFSTWMPK